MGAYTGPGAYSVHYGIYIQYVPASVCCVHEGLCGKCTDVEAANCCYEMIHIASLSGRGMCANFAFYVLINY